jgi:hypothetical protein
MAIHRDVFEVPIQAAKLGGFALLHDRVLAGSAPDRRRPYPAAPDLTNADNATLAGSTDPG